MTVPYFATLYPWTKALHVIAVIAWMAGVFYLPRLFVYHTETARGSAESERFKVMELRLLRAIVTPAMLATWFFGIVLVLTPGIVDMRHDGWFHVKFLAVLLLTGFTGAAGKWRKDFLEDRNTKSARYYRIANEVPTVLMMIAVVMVIVRPF